MDFMALAQECAPNVHPGTLAAIVKVESSYNPYAIGVVAGRLVRQPRNRDEAIATAKALEKAGYNYSVGTSQVNKSNFASQGLTIETAFDTCANIRAGANILQDCYTRALKKFPAQQQALQAAISCYYSGNFSTGFKPDFKSQPSYVEKVLAAAAAPFSPIPVVPLVTTTTQKKAQANPIQAPAEKPLVRRNVASDLDGFSGSSDQNVTFDGFSTDGPEQGLHGYLDTQNDGNQQY